MSRRHRGTAAAGGCGAWKNIVLAARLAQESWRNCTETAAGGATVLTVARRSAAAAPREGAADRPPVHDLVDDLCKKAAILCVGGEILGIAAVPRG